MLKLDPFDLRVKSELSKYRTDSLGMSEQGTWRGRSYGHILPRESSRSNIIPSIREAFWNAPVGKVKLHTDFHHLNSSQGLCFNLFFPFLSSEDYLQILLNALGIEGNPGTGAEFEYAPDPLEHTSIDLLLPLESGARVLIEVKYTETSFGSAKRDREHLDKFALIYRPRFDGRFVPEYEQVDAFLKHYQILRNIWHIRDEEGDIVVFLLPRSNEALRRRVNVIEECTHHRFRKRVRIVYLEDLLETLEKRSVAHPRLCVTLAEFREKYLSGAIVEKKLMRGSTRFNPYTIAENAKGEVGSPSKDALWQDSSPSLRTQASLK